MDNTWLLGGFPGMVLGIWASFTSLRENQWTLLSLFGVGAAMGAVISFILVTGLVAGLHPLYAGGWIMALLSISFAAIAGCILGRIIALVVGRLRRDWEVHRALYAVALGLFAGLMTGTMFASVTVGSGVLEEMLSLIPGGGK